MATCAGIIIRNVGLMITRWLVCHSLSFSNCGQVVHITYGFVIYLTYSLTALRLLISSASNTVMKLGLPLPFLLVVG